MNTFKCRKCGDKIISKKVAYTCCNAPCTKICPLPRIGSKAWDWRFLDSEQLPSDSGCLVSSKTTYAIEISSSGNYSEVGILCGQRFDTVVSVTGRDNVVTAKRIAELLARRDWREEQGKR